MDGTPGMVTTKTMDGTHMMAPSMIHITHITIMTRTTIMIRITITIHLTITMIHTTITIHTTTMIVITKVIHISRQTTPKMICSGVTIGSSEIGHTK
jgi:hypothetical protein